MKKLCILSGVVILSFCSDIWGYDRNARGWYYPTGTSSKYHIASRGGWLYGWPTYPEYGYKEGTFHIGVDVMGSWPGESNDIVNIADGIVRAVASSSSYGSGNGYIILEHRYYDSSGNVKSAYALHGHGLWSDLSRFRVGDSVKAGVKLAAMGNWVYGKHDHFGINTVSARSNGFAYLPSDAIAWFQLPAAQRPKSFRQPTDAERRYFVDPFWFIGNFTPQNWLSEEVPPPSSTGQASLATSAIVYRGEGIYLPQATCEDKDGGGKGVRSATAWFKIKYRPNDTWFSLGKHFTPDNPPRYSFVWTFDVLDHLDPGVYEFYVETESGDGRLLRQYTGRNIDIERSTKPPIRIDDRISTDAQGNVIYWLRSEAEHGRRFVRAMDLWIQAGDRMVFVPPRANSFEATWTFNRVSLGLDPGKYQLFYYFEDVWGTKSELFVPSGRYVDLPALVVPPEQGKQCLFRYEPTDVPWWAYDTYLDVLGIFGPYGPDNFNVDLKIYVEGTQHHRSTEHCPVVYGYRGNGQSYKVMGAWGYGYWMHLYGNIHGLPTGLNSIGAEMRWDGQITGVLRARDAWIWVDNDHPIFDQIIEGLPSGSTINISQTPTLTIHPVMQDPGGSGTHEFRLSLVGPTQRRDFPTVSGYHGQVGCDLQGLSPGRYSLIISYARDKVGNTTSRELSTGVEYNIAN